MLSHSKLLVVIASHDETALGPVRCAQSPQIVQFDVFRPVLRVRRGLTAIPAWCARNVEMIRAQFLPLFEDNSSPKATEIAQNNVAASRSKTDIRNPRPSASCRQARRERSGISFVARTRPIHSSRYRKRFHGEGIAHCKHAGGESLDVPLRLGKPDTSVAFSCNPFD